MAVSVPRAARRTLAAAVLAAACLMAACASMQAELAYLRPADVAGEPSVYAEVQSPPNPVLMGLWRRSNPPGLSKPWIFDYWLVRKGDRLAVFYGYDSRRGNSFKGWAPFLIDGDTMTSGVDGVVFFARDGQVFMRYPGRADIYPMQKVR